MFYIVIMHRLHLASLDLNLLVALDALLRERHVTRAARSIGLSQSAMSHALGRLREAFDDPLLVRGASSMVPTPRAEHLEAPLREILDATEALVAAQPELDPRGLRRLFNIGSEGFLATLLVPPLMRRLREQAPGVDLDVAPRAPRDVAGELERNEIDLALGVFSRAPAAMRIQTLFEERYAVVVRRDHPRVKRRLTLKQYLELPHALIGVGPRGGGPVDSALAARGAERRVMLRIGSFLAAPLIVAQSDLLLTLPERLARMFTGVAPLVVHRPPIELRAFPAVQMWHERRQRDPAHAFLRRLVADAAREV